MEQRTLELNLISAKHLKDVNLFSRMDVYAVVSISGNDSSSNSNQKIKTPVDHDGGTNPTWNFPAKFTIFEAPAQQNRVNLFIKLRCERALGDRDIGEVNVPIKELLDSTGDGKSMQFVSYQVRTPTGKPRGELNFSYKFSDKVVVSGVEKVGQIGNNNQPVTAYPAQPSSTVVGSSSVPYGAPPPPVNYGYPPPPPPQQPYTGYPPTPYAGYPPPATQPGYGYPPQPPPPPPPGAAGYGYPPGQGGPYGYPPVQQPQKKNKFGMGLGAGLLGGAIGGLLIGDMVSDAADYDAGYDAGFDDAGGF